MPRKTVNALADVDVRNAKPGPKAFKLFDGQGLFALVLPAGGKYWRLRYYFGGRERVLALGVYPEVGLREAREQAAAARKLVKEGFDPVQHRRETIAARVNAALMTFEVVAEEWLKKRQSQKTWTAKHIAQIEQSMRDYILPKLGRRPVASLTAQDVIGVLRPLEEAGKDETLRRVRTRIGAVLAYAVQTGRRTDNPITNLAGAYGAPKREHFSSIKPAEIPEFVRRLNAYPGHSSTVGIMRMILWTACRTGEIRGAQWLEFDLDAARWTVPGERMKRRLPHVVALPTQAVELLRRQMEENPEATYVFPTPRANHQMASENVVLQALKRMGYGGTLTGHGIRAAVATALEESGYPLEIIKAQLSHSKANLTEAAYMRGVHIERRAAMMQAWADSLDQAQGDSKVVPMRRAAG